MVRASSTTRLWFGVTVGLLVVLLVGGTVYATFRSTGSSDGPAPQSERASTSPSGSAVPRIGFIGDQISSGSGAGPRMGFAYSVSRSMCFSITNLSFPGSGYVSAGTVGGVYASRLTAALSENPRYIIIQGSMNDAGASAGRLATAANDLLRQVTQRRPAGQVFVLLPFSPPGETAATAGPVRTAALRAGVRVIDPGASGLLQRDDFVADGSYLTQSGHDKLAARVVSELRDAGVARGPGCFDG